MHNFRNLNIWKRGRTLVKEIYNITKIFPKDELWNLTNQIHRSCISIPSNIAEGSGKSSNKDFKRFLEIALASSFELETQIILAQDLGYLSEIACNQICSSIQELQKMICNFMKTLKE